MSEDGIRLYSRRAAWLLSVAVCLYAVGGAWVARAAWTPAVASRLVFLVAAAVLTAALATRRPVSRLPRSALVFVLAGLLLLPGPGGLAVALAAALAGRGAGVTGPWRPGVRAFAVVTTTLALVQFAAPLVATAGPLGSVHGLLASLLLFLVIQAFGLGFGLVFGVDRDEDGLRADPHPSWPTLGLELATVPLAWMLASLLRQGDWVYATILTFSLLGIEITLYVLSGTLGALRRSNHDLASRLTELDTLHAISREILASLDPARVFAVVERETRKMLPVDYVFIALVDPESRALEVVYRRRRGEAVSTERTPLGHGLAVEVMRDKRGRRVDDFDGLAADSPQRHGIVDPRSRSALTVPLIVKDRVVGVLSIQCRRPFAYDDHRLSVLTTVAQQAAVAIENARHYQRATIDFLTGFQVKDHFFRGLSHEYDRAERYGGTFSLLMLDIDGFKGINDHYGHQAGDGYLKGVSAAIRSELRAADTACRYGGDEFCLMLPETGAHGAQVIAERIRTAVGALVVGVEGVTIRATVSIGVATFRRNGGGAAQLLREADEALYGAKRAGRDRVVRYAA